MSELVEIARARVDVLIVSDGVDIARARVDVIIVGDGVDIAGARVDVLTVIPWPRVGDGVNIACKGLAVRVHD
jgi:hypothetical protein